MRRWRAPAWPASLAGLASLACLACLAVAPAGAARADSGWRRYEIVLWHSDDPGRLAAARALGVTAGRIFGLREGFDAPTLAARAAALRDAGLGCYVENIATDHYAAYHRWRPDRPLTALFGAARARHAIDRLDPAAFIRQPGLSDPGALSAIAARLAAHVRALGAAPLYYDLADEAGIADLTAAWDFDLSDGSLAAFRRWLAAQHGSLAALNRAWGTGFAAWEAVRPLRTDAALAVRDGNFAAWADFKAFMDDAFAGAVRAGTEAVHRADPAARAGLEGAQPPGWGGYDYARLAGSVDVMEVTRQDSAQEIAQAMNPALVTLAVSGDGDPRPLWRAALAGGRGVILWDPDGRLVAAPPDGLRGFVADMRGPLGARLLAATPHADAVAMLYSPASFRLRWLLDRQREQDAGRHASRQDWARRTSETELEGNAVRDATRAARAGLARLGLAPRWLSPEMLAGQGLRGVRALILPHALALSQAEVDAVERFVAQGGVVLADIAPGAYDERARRRPAPPRLPFAPLDDLAARLAEAGVAPVAQLEGDAFGPPAELRVLDDGAARILAVLRATDGPATLRLPRPGWLRDLRGDAPPAWADRIAVTASPARPALVEWRER